MKPEAREKSSSEHEQAYHAASRSQAAALSLTSRRLHDVEKPCSVEGQKTGALASQRRMLLSGSGSMLLSSSFKYAWLVFFPLAPHGKEDAHPHVGQGANGH